MDQVDLKTTHGEADIILIQQMIDTVHERHTGVAVPSTDTDVFVLSVYYDVVLVLSIYLIIQYPVRDRCVTDIHNTTQKHSGIARDLFAAQVVFGCYTVTGYYYFGKIKGDQYVASLFSLLSLGNVIADMNDLKLNQHFFVLA